MFSVQGFRSLCSWVGVVVEDRIVLTGFLRDLMDPQGNIRYFSQKGFTNTDWLTDCRRVLLEVSNVSSPKKNILRDGGRKIPDCPRYHHLKWDNEMARPSMWKTILAEDIMLEKLWKMESGGGVTGGGGGRTVTGVGWADSECLKEFGWG